jgi:eukaryotic-like serine/threonine-protein kinase
VVETEEVDDGAELSPSEALLLEIANAPQISLPAAAGERIAHFRVLRVLGRGGMGVVYAAEDERLRRVVALKVLRATDAEGREKHRLLREARAASAVRHANIASVYDIGEADGAAYIAMEHIEGQTLRERLGAGPLAIGEAQSIARELAAALGCAHANGLVHRDLKPENVMIARDGRIKVLDFGLAKVSPERQRDKTTSEQVTKEGVILGTPSYMSPEQASGAPVDARSDIFSLGVVLYEMVTGGRPFRGATAVATLVSVVHDEAPDASKKNPHVPRRLSRIITRCLKKDPRARYSSCEDLDADLARVVAAGSARAARGRLAAAAAIVGGSVIAALSWVNQAPSPGLRDRDALTLGAPSALPAEPPVTAAPGEETRAEREPARQAHPAAEARATVTAGPQAPVAAPPSPSAVLHRARERSRARERDRDKRANVPATPPERPRLDPLSDQK